MKLEQLFESTNNKGTYVAVKFDTDTKNRIYDFVKKHKISNPLDKSKYHTTIIYSKKHAPDLKATGDLDEPWIGKPTKLEIFKTQDGVSALVLIFKCPEIDKRHKEIMDEHKTTYDYPEYNSHITLSYDCGDFDIKSIKDLTSIGEIHAIHEYIEDLNMGWAKENG
mgnify:CR=1 FL=1